MEDRLLTEGDLKAQGFTVKEIWSGRKAVLVAASVLPDGRLLELSYDYKYNLGDRTGDFDVHGWYLSWGSSHDFIKYRDSSNGPVWLSEFTRMLSESGRFVIPTQDFNL